MPTTSCTASSTTISPPSSGDCSPTPRGGADRIRVRILNGVGAPGVAQEVQPLLVDAGGQVTLSGNADRFDYATTQVVYYDDDHRADAEAIATRSASARS